MTGSTGFTGVMKLKVLEASGLEETNVRSQLVTTLNVSSIDPYLQVNVDDKKVAKTSNKKDTFSPVWQEDFISNLIDAQLMSLTIFHSSILGEDPFVANSTVLFKDIIDEGQPDLWVSIFLF